MPRYVLTLVCPDRIGIVHAVSGFLANQRCNIVDSQQFRDPATGKFFMRVHFEGEAGDFASVGTEYAMDWELPMSRRDRGCWCWSPARDTASTTCSTAGGSAPFRATSRASSRTTPTSGRSPRRTASLSPPPGVRGIPAAAGGGAARSGRPVRRRPRGARPVHAGALGAAVRPTTRADHQHQPLVSAQLQGCSPVPAGLRPRREADRRHCALRHRRPRRRADHEQETARHVEHRILRNGAKTVVFR